MQKAVILDSSAIGTVITLDQIIEDTERTHFVTSGVMAELAEWRAKRGGTYETSSDNLRRKKAQLERFARNNAYIDIASYIGIEEEEHHIRHDPYVVMLLYRGYVKPLEIVFMTKNSHSQTLQKYFESFTEHYHGTLRAMGIEVSVTGMGAKIARARTKRFHDRVYVRKKDELHEGFAEFSRKIQEIIAKQAQLERESAPMVNGLRIMRYFEMQPSQVLHYRTMPEILEICSLTRKAFASECFQQLGGVRLTSESARREFVESCAASYSEKILQYAGLHGIKDYSTTKGYAVALTRLVSFVKFALESNDGVIFPQNVSTDANIISAAWQLRGFDEIIVKTCDEDFAMAISLAKRCLRLPKDCVLIYLLYGYDNSSSKAVVLSSGFNNCGK